MENIRIEFTGICKGCKYADISIIRNVYDDEKRVYYVECTHEKACAAVVERDRQRRAEHREAIASVQMEGA